jgi:hypothetical protein
MQPTHWDPGTQSGLVSNPFAAQRGISHRLGYDVCKTRPDSNATIIAMAETVQPEHAMYGMTKEGDAKAHQAGLPRILVIESNPGYRSGISHVAEIAGGQWD